MRSNRVAWLAVTAAFTAGLFPCGAGATSNATQTFPARYVDAPPLLSLDFDVEPWVSAPTIENFETLTTHTPAKLATTARVLFDAKNIYVAIVCDQAGAPLTATQTTNNVGFGLDDFAGIGIDTTGNGQVYYFMTTPRGVRYQQSSESARYNPAWTALAKSGNGKWLAELVIPLKVFRTQGGVQRWRFNIVRRIAVLNDNQSWAYDPIMNDGTGGGFPFFTDSRFWPYLSGVKTAAAAARPKPRAEIYGLVGAGPDRTQTLLADQDFEPLGFRYAGVDVNVPLTGTIAFVGTLAPDFSNVEIDQQTIAPQEFRRALVEYRPFFAQGAQYFVPAVQIGVNQAPDQTFYSPDIGPFNRGEKVEGTYGLQSIGLLNFAGAGFDDSVFGFKHALPDRTFMYSFNAVDAHHQDGNLTLDTSGGNDFTWEGTVGGRNLHTGFVYGLDYAAETGTAAPDTTPGLAYKTIDFVDVHKQNYETYVGYTNIGPQFNPVDGFTNLADLNGVQEFFDFYGNPPASSPIKRNEIFILADRYVERDGYAHQSDFNLNGDLVFRNMLHLNANMSVSSVRLFDDGLSNVGYTYDYKGGVTYPFNSSGLTLGYKDGTATPLDFGYSWGPFTTFSPNTLLARPTYLRQYTATTSRPLGKYLTLGLEYDGTFEQYPTSNPNAPAYDGQNLRRVSLGASLGPDANASISLRDVNGNGGFGTPGLNVAMSYHVRFHNDSELFLNYGTPAATSTLDRVLLKYLVRFGSGAGT